MKLICILTFVTWGLGLITGVALAMNATALALGFLAVLTLAVVIGIPWVLDGLATPLAEESERNQRRLDRLEAHLASNSLAAK